MNNDIDDSKIEESKDSFEAYNKYDIPDQENNLNGNNKNFLKVFYYSIFGMFLFLLVVYSILPKDLKSNIENKFLTQLFQIRLNLTDIDYSDNAENLFKKHCGQYVNKDICEIQLFYNISANNKNEELYNYCVKKENSTKQFCQSGYNHMLAGLILNKLPILEKELNKWKIENNIELKIELDSPDYSKIYYNSVFSGISIKILGSGYFYDTLNNKYFTSKGINEKAFYNYYGSKTFAIDINNIDLETFKKILAIIKEEIDKQKNNEIQLGTNESILFMGEENNFDSEDKQTIKEINEIINQN